MSSTVLGLLAFSLLALPPASPSTGDELLVNWGRKKIPAAALTDDVPPRAAAAISTWIEWAEATGYRMDLAADGRALLLSIDSNKGRKNAKKNLKLIDEIVAMMEEILPLPPTRVAGPEQDEEDDTFEWGHVERETQIPVLLELDDLIHYSAAINHLTTKNRYLGGWATTAARMTGFVIESPLTGAWMPKTGIKEDYEGNPTNEMVNRLAQMLTLGRFGQQPYWMRMGIAWHVEMKAMKGIYCFPYRSGFVRASSHTNWEKLIENRLGRRKEPMVIEEVAGLERGRWDTELAEMAWGTATFLIQFHPDALPEILDEFYTMWDLQGRIEDDDGTWERIPEFEPSLSDQLAVIEKHVPDFLPELTKFFAKGKHYKP